MPSVRTAVWSCMRPGRNAPTHRVRPCSSVTTVAFLVFCFFSRHEGAAAGLARAGAPDRHFGSVQAQRDTAGGGVGEHVSQGLEPDAGLAGHGEPAGGRQRPDLPDRAGDGGAADAVQRGQGLVRELKAQVDEGGDDPVDERQVVVGAGARRAQPIMSLTRVQPVFPGRPWTMRSTTAAPRSTGKARRAPRAAHAARTAPAAGRRRAARLGGNGLIERIARTNTYRLTADGLTFALVYSRVHDQVLYPLTAHDQPIAAPAPVAQAHPASITPATTKPSGAGWFIPSARAGSIIAGSSFAAGLRALNTTPA
jgi:hypothetical protein